MTMMSRVEVFIAASILCLAADRVCAQVCTDNDIRLVGSTNPLEGRVELCYQGQWGTVCDDSFGPTDAGVVCRQLGFSPENATISRQFGPGSGNIVLDDVQCLGDEVQLTNCSHRGLGVHNCDPNEDIGVTCQDGFLYTLDMMEYTATEDNRAVLVCMVCTSLVSEQPSATTVTVMLSTADGTAVDGIDYIGIQQPVVCQHSQPPLCRNISILADLTDESVEYFHVNLRGNQTTRLDGARVVITDSDTPGIGFEKRAYIVLENAGEARVCITTNVTLNANSIFGFVTTYTEDITATAGIDYVGLETTDSLLTFQTGGNNTLCVMIMIIDDNNIEPAESFSVRFRFTQTGSNIPVFAPTTTVVILDQDQEIFYPYGSDEGDEFIERGDDSNSTEIRLPQPFPFRSSREDVLYVNTNGILSFRESVPSANQAIRVPVIAPFWDDVDTRLIGNVSYRITTDPVLLERVFVTLQNHFGRFYPTYLVIATWNNVPEYNTAFLQQNTFQAVMATDGVMTFAFFIYIDLQWMGFSDFIGGFSTFIGFCSHAPSPQCSCTISNRLFLTSFSTCNIRNNILSDLRSGSNVDAPGVYVHRVDGQEILRPFDCADGEVQLANLASGGVAVHICSNRLLERVCGGGWNNRHAAVVCRQLGFSVEGAVAVTYELMGESPPIVRVSACNGTEPNLFACNETIPPASISGSGSGDVEEQLSGSCSHFAGVHCNTTVVGLEQPAYTVGEDSVVIVCVQRSSSGIYPLVVFLRTVDVSAQAGNDYIGVITPLQFLPGSHQICAEVNITRDNETELTESFLVFLTSNDATVVIDLQFAYVYIIDNNVDLDPVPSSAAAPTATIDLNPALYTPETATPAVTPNLDLSSPLPDGSTSVTVIAGILFAVAVCCLLGGIGLFLILYCRRRRKTFEITGVSNANIVNDCDQLHHHKDLPEDLVIPSSTIRLLSSIGEGEFGIVYKAHWVRSMHCVTGYAMPDVVAAKTLKGFFTQDQTEEMIKEGLKMKSFDHPNVLGIIGFCIDAGPAPYVIMPFMANGSLLSYLKRERSNLVVEADSEFVQTVQKKLMDMCLQIAMGMEYLAHKRIVHRDLAARNCMIDIHFVIKVADFGLSESVYTSTYFRQEKNPTVRLPLKWMSPESMTDGFFSEKTDVWSYGITCWEVFTGGKLPYPGVDPHSLPYLLEDGHRPEKPNNAACSDNMYSCIRNCWHKDPEMRPTFTAVASTISEQLQSTAGYLAIGDFEELPKQYKGIGNEKVGAVKVTAL